MKPSTPVSPSSDVTRARILRCFLILLVLAWSVPVTYALRFYLPFNPSRLASRTPPLVALVPEGWGFFTRDPREEDVFIYFKSDSNTWLLLSQWTFGFDRSGRRTSREGRSLLTQIDAEAAACRKDHVSCLDDVAPQEKTATTDHVPTLCGDVGFVIQEPIPWAWASADVVMPSRVVRVRVTC